MKTMREIKFRGVDAGGWLYGFLYEDETGTYIKDGAKNKRFGTGLPVDARTVGQFTGLKDKNGKEIYEGDILKTDFMHASWWFYSDPRPTGRDGYSTVEGLCAVEWPYVITNITFPKKDFWFDRYPNLDKEIIKRLSGTQLEPKKSIVIGNIYENPELLKTLQ